ncbi:hemerythrin domain-containing protein [candidate division KSB1 bacterium]|nr:hemerythrin domain-containing protein [candidate division KSB1 bacterium]MCH8956975.1 hemerythrin domain-containing protein [candidate division KSB1 bacterium]
MERDKTEVAEKIAKDHESIRRYIGALNLSEMTEVDAKEFFDWKLEFIWQLRDFKNRLLKHFDLEEEGGFMEDIVKVAPHLSRKVSGLKVEHDQILMSLDEILFKLKRMKKKNDTELEQVQFELNDVITSLRDHENEENILMQQAYYREFGSPG